MNSILDNIVWHTLCGPHARFAVGGGEIRRYAKGFTPFVGFADLSNPDLAALADHVEPGEQLYCDGWSGTAPEGWRIESESILCRMTWEGALPAGEDAPQAVLLDARHASAALELAVLTRPGPFSLRTLELGEYFGIFDGEHLVAMAGARFCAGQFSEITGICTHPDFRGKGLARGLVARLLRHQLARNAILFLRVMRDNDAAHRAYQRMGFRDYRESVAREFSRLP